jgi:fusaric acid resistance family protein
MVIQVQAAPAKRSQYFAVGEILSDLRVRYGIKMGLAGILALYLTQLIRLDHANWAILTVMVMMNSHYVGATSIKAINRVIGTVAGAVLGVWVVGTYSTAPTIFLPIVFVVIAIATYKFGQFPASQTPYAYFLVGNTLIAVITFALYDPNNVWRIGISRALETLTGVVASLLVSSILWPRYAREEFVGATRSVLEILDEFFTKEMDAYLHQCVLSEAELERIKVTFVKRMSALRNLFRAAAREGNNFRLHLPNYNAAITALVNLFQAGLILERWVPAEAPLLDRVKTETEGFAAAVSEELRKLQAFHSPGQSIPSSRLSEAFDSLEAKCIEVRDDGSIVSAPSEIGTSFLGHFAALQQIKEDLDVVREMITGLPRVGHPPPPIRKAWALIPEIDMFWLKTGLKGGLAVAIALLLMRWIHPPGSTALPLSAWLFTIGGRVSLRAGTSGDQRVFQRLAFATALYTLAFALLVFLTPVLANYGVMNATLFLILFLYGFFSARILGLNYGMNLALLGASIFVALNPQVPVSTKTIYSSFLGLLTGLAIAAVISRVIWPVLPQRILRDDLLELIAGLKTILSSGAVSEKTQTRLTVIPVEARQAAALIYIKEDSTIEKGRLERMILGFQSVGAKLRWLARERQDLPAQVEALIRPRIKEMEAELMRMLEKFEHCFRTGDCRVDFPTLDHAKQSLLQVVGEVREKGLLRQESFDVVVRSMDFVNRHLATADAFIRCAERVRALRIDRYWGDWVL